MAGTDPEGSDGDADDPGEAERIDGTQTF